MDFYTSLTVRKIHHITEMETMPIGPPEHHPFELEAPDFESALHELHKLTEDICYQVAKNEVICCGIDKDIHKSVEVEGKCLGIGMTARIKLTEEFEKEVKPHEPDKPKLNETSLHNDINYGISMLRSASSPKGDKAWITDPSIVWQYYILQKHFGTPIPKELREIANDAQK